LASFQGLRNGLRLLRPRAGSSETALTVRSPCVANPFLFGLAPCGVCPAASITVRAVRSYRTFSPLPRGVSSRASQRLSPASPSRPAGANQLSPFAHPGAVCFLWHFPSNGLKSILPDVIRHTALRSSDFPLSFRAARDKSRRSRKDSDHPVETCFSVRPFTLRQRWLTFQQVSAAGSTLLACIFKAALKSRLTRSASRSCPRPAFSCLSGHNQRSLPVAKFNSKTLRLFSSRRSPSGPLDPSGS
jgi:hypothetical protein